MSISYYNSPRRNTLAKRIEEQHQEQIRRQIPAAHEAANQINEQFDQENAEHRQSAFVAAIDQRLRWGVPAAQIDAVKLFADAQGADVSELSASERQQASAALAPLVQRRAALGREQDAERRQRERRAERADVSVSATGSSRRRAVSSAGSRRRSVISFRVCVRIDTFTDITFGVKATLYRAPPPPLS